MSVVFFLLGISIANILSSQVSQIFLWLHNVTCRCTDENGSAYVSTSANTDNSPMLVAKATYLRMFLGNYMIAIKKNYTRYLLTFINISINNPTPNQFPYSNLNILSTDIPKYKTI